MTSRLLIAVPCMLACACAPTPAPDTGPPDEDSPAFDAGTDAGTVEMDTGMDGGVDLPAFDCTLDPFGEAFGMRVIETLARPEWEGRGPTSEGLRLATEWTARQFECIGLTPGAPSLTGRTPDTMRQPLMTDGDDVAVHRIGGMLGTSAVNVPLYDYTYEAGRMYSFTNVIGSLPGQGSLANEVIVIGAHLDALGRVGTAGDMVVLGADDDGSGIAAVLAIARDLVDNPPAGDRRTIVFAAWGIEEEPFFARGSEHFMRSLTPTAADNIMYYVNFDMVGHYPDDNQVDALGAYPVTGAFAASAAWTVLDGLRDSFTDLTIDTTHTGDNNSDFASFCRRSIPYVFFFTGNRDYHTPGDTPDRIDVPTMRRIFELASRVTAGLASEPDLSVTRSEFVRAHMAQPDMLDCSMPSP